MADARKQADIILKDTMEEKERQFSNINSRGRVRGIQAVGIQSP